ncbi:unnamed protein product [Caenorhabditis brenneri]
METTRTSVADAIAGMSIVVGTVLMVTSSVWITVTMKVHAIAKKSAEIRIGTMVMDLMGINFFLKILNFW